MPEIEDIPTNEPPAEAAKPAETVKLSSSVAKIMLEKSALHAWQYHRLLGGSRDEDTEATRDGHIYEAIIFGLDNRLTIIDAENFRTNKAKADRDAAIAAKRIPVLASDYPDYVASAQAISRRLKAQGIVFMENPAKDLPKAPAFWHGSQVRIVWFKNGVECSGFIDYLQLSDSSYTITDLKIVDDASPKAVQRKITDYGYDIQHAAYVEAIETIYPELAGRGHMQFLFCEKKAPHAINIQPLSGSFKELGARKWARAQRLWLPCLRDNVWPGYENTPPLDAAPWQLGQELDAQLDEEQDNGK